MTEAPQKSDWPVGAGQVANETTSDAAILAQASAEDNGKAVTTLIAQFARAGHSVHTLADGGFLVCKWSQARHCPDVHALASFARQVGVRA